MISETIATILKIKTVLTNMIQTREKKLIQTFAAAFILLMVK